MRFRFPFFVACLAIITYASCDQLNPGSTDTPQPGPSQGRVLGVCFMGGDACQSIYVDLGEYEATGRTKLGQEIPVYIFPSSRSNPLDSTGQYNPNRLQNNLFASHGRVWAMHEVHSKNLILKAEPAPGEVLLGLGVTDADTVSQEGARPRTRDLYRNPITGLNELLALEAMGEVEIVNLFFNTDCPLATPNDNDTVVNLNPNYPICGE